MEGDGDVDEEANVDKRDVPSRFASAKRGPPKGSSPGKGGQDILTKTTSNVISDGIWYGVDQATSEDAAVKRSPRGARFRPGGADVLTDVVTDWVPSGISSWFGGDDEASEGAKVKRSPKGGRFRQGGKDVLTDVVSDGISTGIWYGVDEATNEQRSSSVPDEALDTGFDIDPEEFKKMNYGLPPNTEPSIYNVWGGSIQKRGRGCSRNRKSSSSGAGSSSSDSTVGARSGLAQAAKDSAKDMTQDVGNDAAAPPHEPPQPFPAPVRRGLRFSA